MASEQLQNLMKRFGVTTRKDLLQAIADDFTNECCDPGDEPFRAEDMEGTLDQMLEAEYQRIAGGAYDPEPEPQPELCSCPARIYGGDCAHTIDEEFELTGWNAEMAQAERDAEERAFWEGL